MPSSNQASASAQVRLWLFIVAVLVLAMVGVGGATRLTGSGLSITEWQPVMGAVPPLTDGDWQEAFAKYKQIPQYQIVNRGMSLAEFKAIFWWEWGHRLLGRLTGVVFAAGLLWFWWRGALQGRLGWQLLGLLALGGVQGLVGWLMVQSGLTDRVLVSQYKLALHLTLAIVILGLLVWIALGVGAVGSPDRSAVTLGQRRTAHAILGLLLVQVIAGAFVAGTKAGFTFNTWPLMDGQLVPAGLFGHSPWWLAPFEDLMTIQFNHRILAYALVGLAIWHAVDTARAGAAGAVGRSAIVLAAVMVGQAALGIWTLLWVVPISLGLAHQTLAAALFALAVRHVWLVNRARASA